MMVCPQTAYGLSADWLIDRGFMISKLYRTALAGSFILTQVFLMNRCRSVPAF